MIWAFVVVLIAILSNRCIKKKRHGAKYIKFYVRERFGRLRRIHHMALKSNEKAPIIMRILDSENELALVNGAPAWSVDNEDLARLEVAADGLSATIVPLNRAGGVVHVVVKANASFGPEPKMIEGSLDVEITSMEAVKIELTLGEAVPQ